jgi:Na+-driven multidrug efflux pump
MRTLPGRLVKQFPDRERRRRVWAIAVPIMGGMMSQNVLNLVDIGMVGRLGDIALAATGIGSFANYLALAFIIGLSAGVQALAARRLGEGRTSETAVPLNGGLILALIIGIPTCALLVLASPFAFNLLTDDPAVRELGVPYLQVRVLSMIAVGMNFSFRGYWSAIHMTGVYLRTLLIMHAINIFLHWVLIFAISAHPRWRIRPACPRPLRCTSAPCCTFSAGATPATRASCSACRRAARCGSSSGCHCRAACSSFSLPPAWSR